MGKVKIKSHWKNNINTKNSDITYLNHKAAVQAAPSKQYQIIEQDI